MFPDNTYCFDCTCGKYFPTLRQLLDHCEEMHKVEPPRFHIPLAPHTIGTPHKFETE
jgi:hypothetical protein